MSVGSEGIHSAAAAAAAATASIPSTQRIAIGPSIGPGALVFTGQQIRELDLSEMVFSYIASPCPCSQGSRLVKGVPLPAQFLYFMARVCEEVVREAEQGNTSRAFVVDKTVLYSLLELWGVTYLRHLRANTPSASQTVQPAPSVGAAAAAVSALQPHTFDAVVQSYGREPHFKVVDAMVANFFAHHRDVWMQQADVYSHWNPQKPVAMTTDEGLALVRADFHTLTGYVSEYRESASMEIGGEEWAHAGAIRHFFENATGLEIPEILSKWIPIPGIGVLVMEYVRRFTSVAREVAAFTPAPLQPKATVAVL